MIGSQLLLTTPNIIRAFSGYDCQNERLLYGQFVLPKVELRVYVHKVDQPLNYTEPIRPLRLLVSSQT